MKKLLVIAYYYPPMTRVGGRRWFLFVKYLRRLGVDVSVLTFADLEEPPASDSTDLFFVLGERLAHLPYFKQKLPESFLEKIRWKGSFYADRISRHFISFDPYDHSLGAVQDFYAKAKIVVSRGIDTVVLTVGPFSYSSILADLKRDFPHVKFVLDYRDDRFRDKDKLSKTQLKGELRSELSALEAADIVLAVDQNIANILSASHPALDTPIRVLPHGYDEDDFKGLSAAAPVDEHSKVKLVYGGACYNGVEKYYTLFAEFLKIHDRQIETAALYFTFLTDDVRGILKDSHSINLMPPVSRQEMLKIQTLESDLNLVVYPETNFEARSSKFYELIRCGRPILFFGPEGPTAQYIRDNQLGVTITTAGDLKELDLSELRNGRVGTKELTENSIFELTNKFQALVHSI